MAFSIAFENKPLHYPYEDRTTAAATGLLVLGDYREQFESSLHQWSKQDYERQWKHAINVLLHEKRAALITTYLTAEVSSHLEWRPMYAVDNAVYVQHQLLFYHRLTEPFSLEKAFAFLAERNTTNQDGQQISEWKVRLSEIEAFARELT